MKRNSRNSKSYSRFVFFEVCAIVVLLIVYIWIKVTGDIRWLMPNLEASGQLGDSFGAVNALFSGLAFAAVVITLILQVRSQEKTAEIDRYFKMIDFYQIAISNMTTTTLEIPNDSNKASEKVQGRKVFAEMKLQLKKLLVLIDKINTKEKFDFTKDQVAAIAYLIFYYGANGAWKDFLKEELKDYPRHDELVEKVMDYLKVPAYNRYALGRTNQTDLSAYFRNMYNAIKLVDESRRLTNQEKYDYVKILRAQISNPELYILFFNILSPFGAKWKSSGYIERYRFLDNIPKLYCDGYEPSEYFPIEKNKSKTN